MKKICIISSSIREGRKSQRVTKYFENYIRENNLGSTEILDLEGYNFPLFHERFRNLAEPGEDLVAFREKLVSANGIIIVTPEYNGGYPASLKNIIDVFYDEWYHKPVAITTVSNGAFGGSQVITSLQFVLWKMKAFIASAMFPVPNIDTAIDDDGIPADKAGFDKRAAGFLKELSWAMDAVQPR
jgi:NAD(P)H-dependent FMN reductase